VAAVRDDASVPAEIRFTFGVYAVLAKVAQQEPASDAMLRLKNVVEESGDEVVTGWRLDGVRYFVRNEPSFRTTLSWVNSLLDALESWDPASFAERLPTLQDELENSGGRQRN
jgi:hypothetical protein